MELSLIFLGTAGAVPTPSRGLSATLLQRGGDRFLVDCGEGTQRQMIKAAIGITQIRTVLLTHLHADHYLGLPGMFKTWELWGRTDPVVVIGPRGLYDLVESLRRIIGRLAFTIDWQESTPGERFSFPGYAIETIATEHRIPSLGYAFIEEPRPGRFCPQHAAALGVPEGPAFGKIQRGESVTTPAGATVRPQEVLGPARPGRRIVLTGDTRPCDAVVKAADGADVLVHDATFLTSRQDRADQTGHSTAAEAAHVALRARVRLLALTHISFRHLPREVLSEAREIFGACVLPADFERLLVPFSEKGCPQLLKPKAAEGEPKLRVPLADAF